MIYYVRHTVYVNTWIKGIGIPLAEKCVRMLGKQQGIFFERIIVKKKK